MQSLPTTNLITVFLIALNMYSRCLSCCRSLMIIKKVFNLEMNRMLIALRWLFDYMKYKQTATKAESFT